MNKAIDILVNGAKEFGVTLNSKHIDSFFKYKDILLDWNKKINLTSILDEQEIIIKHFLDSLSILRFIKNQNIRLIDVGTGAGFPGIPIKIANNNIDVTLVDSLEKRVKFLNYTINELNLLSIKAIHQRAEESGINKDYREKFDISIARAVSSLPVLLEYCLPLTKINGIFIAMKGFNKEEIDVSNKALDILGGKIEKIEDFVLPFSDIKRSIIIIRKFRETPTAYPRKSGKPTKQPLI